MLRWNELGWARLNNKRTKIWHVQVLSLEPVPCFLQPHYNPLFFLIHQVQRPCKRRRISESSETSTQLVHQTEESGRASEGDEDTLGSDEDIPGVTYVIQGVGPWAKC